MQDFAWGLEQKGHSITILTSDAPYLEKKDKSELHSTMLTKKDLRLKGSFENGLSICTNQSILQAIDSENKAVIIKIINMQRYDGVILGNLDLIGYEIIPPLLATGIPIRHHLGFVMPPYDKKYYPQQTNYQLVAASYAVRKNVIEHGWPVEDAPVIYPGARCDLFGSDKLKRSLPEPLGLSLTSNSKPLGSFYNPLQICFAGLIMPTKGVHTIVEAIVLLREKGVHTFTRFAGKAFDKGYVEEIQKYLALKRLREQVQFVGQLDREQLARFYLLNHVAVFPSIYPEAFGIVAAEAMASGLVLVSSGAGGASELFEDKISGLSFQPGNSQSLAEVLHQLVLWPSDRIRNMAISGQIRVRASFSIDKATEQFEDLFRCYN